MAFSYSAATVVPAQLQGRTRNTNSRPRQHKQPPRLCHVYGMHALLAVTLCNPRGWGSGSTTTAFRGCFGARQHVEKVVPAVWAKNGTASAN